jgi:hypothetical protein
LLMKELWSWRLSGSFDDVGAVVRSSSPTTGPPFSDPCRVAEDE